MSESTRTTTIESPLNAKVACVHKAIGDRVRQGDDLVSLDIAKMTYVVKAACTGKVVQLPAQEGTNVEAGGIIAVILNN